MAFTPIDPNKAEVRITGEAPDYGLDFYIPRGERGEVGPTGPQGPAVPTNLSIGTIEVGPAAPGTVGPQGLTGPKGDPGGITLGTVLSTNDLNLIITSGVYRQDNGTYATIARNYPKEGVGGVLIVTERVAPGASASVIQHWTPVVSTTAGAPIIFTRYSTTNNTIWSPWRMFASSRVDQTAGRVIYQWDDINGREQLIYGDTGFRDIASSLVNGVTGTVAIRRYNSIVEISTVLTLPDNLASGTALFDIPVGFRPTRMDVYRYTRPSASATQITYRVLNPTVSLSAPNWGVGWGNLRITETFTTTEAWPTSLPGTVIGTIPNV